MMAIKPPPETRNFGKWSALLLLAAVGGCGTGLGFSSVPIAPGDTPFLMIKVINRSSTFTVDFLIQTETTTVNGTTVGGGELRDIRSNGGDAALVVPCPVDRVGLGNLNDPNSTGYRVGFTGQTDKVEVPWNRNPLVSGFSYNCGDTIVFLVTDSQTDRGGVLVTTGLIGGASEMGPFSGPDTFEILEDLLRAEGLLE
jgi:hypothetical protein